MYLKLMIMTVVVLLGFVACSEKTTKDEFYIVQDGVKQSAKEIILKKVPFEIKSSEKAFSVVMSKEPIRNLADHKEIVKLTGTTGAWYLGHLPLYQRSDLLSDRNACYAYFGNEGEGCQEYIREKTRLGFKLHYAYTFAEYFVPEKSVMILGIGRKSMEKLPSGKYHLYLFRSEHPMGKVARSQRVTRMIVNVE